ncbi:hypothetical protein [Haladaptatus sp. DYF46]|uniref:DUF7344 domain-containing protein n=1 Tax=Haladaptatus sp. DYF46 TaxID=2886041 RepID=UPI001E2FD8A9|nr:hypothetical protein [Haladaptatus sp. DYF46]
MVETNDRRRPGRATATPKPKPPMATFDDAAKTFGLGVLLRIPPELHEALSADARREVLAYLYEIDREVTVTELADYLAATGIEHDRDRAETALHHTHLPKLDALGAVRWNRDDGTVRLAR